MNIFTPECIMLALVLLYFIYSLWSKNGIHEGKRQDTTNMNNGRKEYDRVDVLKHLIKRFFCTSSKNC